MEPKKPESWIKRIKRNRWYLLILISLIVYIDFLLILVAPKPYPTYFYADKVVQQREDRDLFWKPRHRFKPQIKLLEEHREDQLLFFFGGSMLSSWKTETNFVEETQRNIDSYYRAVNFGVGGYGSYQATLLAKRMINLKKPKVVVLSSAFNDIDLAPASDHHMAERNREFSVSALYLMRKSRLLSAWERFFRKVTDRPFDDWKDLSKWSRRSSVEQSRQNFVQLIQLIEQKNASLVFLTQGSSDQAMQKQVAPYFDMMQKLAADHKNVFYLDVRPLFEKRFIEAYGEIPPNYSEKSLMLFVDLCHYNDDGHMMVGKFLGDYLIDQGLISKMSH